MLLQNPNVAKCSEKLISYRNDFKISAVKHYEYSTNSDYRRLEYLNRPKIFLQKKS